MIHPSICALLDDEGINDPFIAIRKRARAVVTQAQAMGWQGPPFDVSEVASMRGLKVEKTFDFADDLDACVMPGKILLNARKPEVRQRYSVAHEVGHTLFPDYEAMLGRTGKLWRRHSDETEEFERLCQAAAAEILLPYDAFQAALLQYGRTIAGIIRTSIGFEASIEATARRMVETADYAMAVIYVRPFDRDTGDWLHVERRDGHWASAGLKIAMVCANEQSQDFAKALRTIPPADCTAVKAWKRVALARGAIITYAADAEDWEHVGVIGKWSSESVTLPRGSGVPNEVLCVLQRTSHDT